MGLWTDRARPVIERVLAEVPAGASEAEVKKALSAAYPFGQRINYPYQAWLKACQKAVAKRFAGRVGQQAPPQVCLVMTTTSAHVTGTWPWLNVLCDWCKDTGLPSCMMCGEKHRLFQQAVQHPEFQKLRRNAICANSDTNLAVAMLLDWCEEFLGERPVLLQEKEDAST